MTEDNRNLTFGQRHGLSMLGIAMIVALVSVMVAQVGC